jgi:hypothetical protein
MQRDESSAETTEGTYIRFVSIGVLPQEEVTERWRVDAKDGACLGYVSWFGRWRRYSFSPATGTVFEQVCLREIANFIEGRIHARKAALNG